MNLSKNDIDSISESEACRKYWLDQSANPGIINSWELYRLDDKLDTAVSFYDIASKNDSVFVRGSNITPNDDLPYLPQYVSEKGCIWGGFNKFEGYKISDFLNKFSLSVSLEDYTKQLEIKIDTLKIKKQKWYTHDSINRFTFKIEYLFKDKILYIDTVETNTDYGCYVVIDNPICPVPISVLKESYDNSEFVKLFYDQKSQFYFLKTSVRSAFQDFEIKEDKEHKGEYFTIVRSKEQHDLKMTFGLLTKK